MIRHRIIVLTGVLMLTTVSITGCKGIKKETGSSSVVESVEEKATETASKEEPDVGMGNPWEEITEDEAKKSCVRLFKAPDGAKDQDTPAGNRITDEEALSAVKNYCHENNPDLERIEEEGKYPVYWDIESSDEKEIVVLFRSYTGAQIRYHINPESGDTYVAEFVPGITSEEEKTDESFNVRDYLSGNDASSNNKPSVKGTWETGSIGYEADDGTVQPLYYVQFTDSEINYGHLKEGEFVSEYSDKISLIEEPEEGRYKVQAEASNGGKYTYQTCETDKDTLEYFDTWDEKEFPEKYSGGASLSKSNYQ
ncbi:MAG: hypothetical protein K6A90_10895 [Lachnospiraceae bacterium]|nr:hypothetical protein [Lachnospiraceae bacterium]